MATMMCVVTKMMRKGRHAALVSLSASVAGASAL